MPVNLPTTLACPSCGAPLEFDGTSSIVHCWTLPLTMCAFITS